ncbi:MAG: flagellar hook assembly protein FlgD [Myxococcota bacterium]|nr:flagellar hook assembly protein FlgD [Myxococcota bacterium]
MEINGIPDNLRLQPSAEPTATQDLDKDSFLKLLVTQLQNQNPLEPMENTEFIGQMAQFSSLEQQVQTNSNLSELALATSAQISSQAVNLVGKQVMVPGDHVELVDAEADLHLSLPASIATGQVEVVDENGDVVRRIRLGAQSEGPLTVTWDGRDDEGRVVEPGSYRIRAEGLDAQGRTVDIATHLLARVDAVVFEAGIPRLRAGGRMVNLGDVREVHP